MDGIEWTVLSGQQVDRTEWTTELPDLALREFVLWLLRRRSRFRITGNSMLPLLKPNEEVLVNPYAYRNASPQLGDVVIALHPQKPGLKVVKRVTRIEQRNPDVDLRVHSDDAKGGERYFLLGENLVESTDSRSFGWVEAHLLQGRVTSRFG